MSTPRIIVGLVALMLPLAVASAEVYKWTDEDGQPVYSDKPRPDADRIEVETQADDRQEGSRTAQGSGSAGGQPPQGGEKGEKGKKANKEKCTKWKDRLFGLKNSDEVYRETEEGERKLLSDKEVQLEIKRAELKVDRYCPEGAKSSAASQ